MMQPPYNTGTHWNNESTIDASLHYYNSKGRYLYTLINMCTEVYFAKVHALMNMICACTINEFKFEGKDRPYDCSSVRTFQDFEATDF